MADKNDRRARRREKVFEPFRRREIKVVRRFVEQHDVGLFEQEFRKTETVKLAAA